MPTPRFAKDSLSPLHWVVALFGTALVIGLMAASSARAEALAVENTADSGDGSLRAAIEAANGTTEPDKIVFEPAAAGVIELGTALPEVIRDLSIIGRGRAR